MKTLKLFSTLLLGMFALTALTSCLGDDDDNGTSATMLETEEQRTNALSSMAGSYNGTLYYYDVTAAENTGKTALIWTINSDGTFTANNFPMSVFANYTGNIQEKAVLAAVGNQKVTAKITPYAAYGSNYQSSFEPSSTAYEYKVKLNEGDEIEHTVVISLVHNYTTSQGSAYSSVVYETTNRILTATVLVDKIVIDGQIHDIKSYVVFSGTR